MTKFFPHFIAIVFVLLMTSGCQSTDYTFRPDASSYPRPHSEAIPQSTNTALRRALAPDVQQHKNQSGFRLLTTGTDSLDMRLALIRAAEKTLDLQYYTMHDDVTGNLLLKSVLEAAERGVRVRFLLDGISVKEVGNSLSLLDKAKNVEIRIFNPMTVRQQSLPAQLLGKVFDLGQANKRMHNKSLIADNQMAIIGGRNLGDEYFEANADVSFKDLDILSAGPVVADISHSFDHYWNDENTFPIDALIRPKTDPEDVKRLKRLLQHQWKERLKTEDGRKMLQSVMASRLKQGDIMLIWADAQFTADRPEKIETPKEHVTSKPIMDMMSLVRKSKKEFLVVSPYFVPQDEGVNWLAGLEERGMDVKVLTNSLASTDVVIVHTGYQRYRKPLLEKGVTLYELKPVGGRKARQRLFGTTAPAHASLHSKAYVLDRKHLIIGSFNMDPRSYQINTEIALIIDNPQLAGQVVQLFKESTSPQDSYRLALDKGRILWLTEKNGRRVHYTSDPEAGIWRRVQLFLMSLLPVEDHL